MQELLFFTGLRAVAETAFPKHCACCLSACCRCCRKKAWNRAAARAYLLQVVRGQLP